MTPTQNILDTLAFNDEGYLLDWKQWTEAVGEAIAEDEGITLTPRHWDVIRYARQVYAEEGDAPTLRQITKQANISTKEMYDLFPDGPAKKAAMIAGLPKPTGCI